MNTPRINHTATAARLVDAHARTGWVIFDGHPWRHCLIAVYTRLAAELDPRTATGDLTLAELAEQAGYSPRHITRCIKVIVGLGVLLYRPGGFRAGRPVPSWFAIVRSRLADLLGAARDAHDVVLADRRAAVLVKGAEFRLTYTPRPLYSAAPRPDPRPSRLVKPIDMATPLPSCGVVADPEPPAADVDYAAIATRRAAELRARYPNLLKPKRQRR